MLCVFCFMTHGLGLGRAVGAPPCNPPMAGGADIGGGDYKGGGGHEVLWQASLLGLRSCMMHGDGPAASKAQTST